jgi:hypothetical protein
MYSQIKFIYSLPFDRLLTEYSDKLFNEQQIKEVVQYIKRLQTEWGKINDLVFEILESYTGNKLQKSEIKCYVVKYCKLSGISNPLTIRMDYDFDYIFDTLIHELIHILTIRNPEKYKKIEQELKKIFPKEEREIISHVYIIFIELQIIKKIFNEKILNKIIERTKTFKIGEALEIVLREEEVLKNLFI